MATDSRRLMRLAAYGVAPAALLVALATVWPTPGARAESAAAKPIQVAEVPMPRANPLNAAGTGASAATAAASSDPIAALAASAADEEQAVTEDSDAPQSGLAPPPPAPKKLPMAASSKVDLSAVGLRYALKFLDDGDPAAATAAAYALPNPIDTKIIDWLVATSGRDDVPSSRLAEVWRKLADWPGQTLLQIRFEQALVREDPSPAAVIQGLRHLRR